MKIESLSSLPNNKLFIRKHFGELRGVVKLEAKLSGVWIIGEQIYDARWKREHHISGQFHLTPEIISFINIQKINFKQNF